MVCVCALESLPRAPQDRIWVPTTPVGSKWLQKMSERLSV